MKICVNCGREQNENTRFCAKCGTELVEKTVSFYPPAPLVRSESGRDLIEPQYKEYARNYLILDILITILFILIMFRNPIIAILNKGRIRESDLPSLAEVVLCLIIFSVPIISLAVIKKRAQNRVAFYRSLATKEFLTVESYGVTGECEQGKVNLTYGHIKNVKTEDVLGGGNWGDWILKNPVLIITDCNEKRYKFYTFSNQNQIRASIVNQIIRQSQEK